MRTVSWVLLAIVAVLLILGGLSSLTIAYFGAASSDVITGSTSLQDLNITPEAATALRGRRGTAAAFCLGFGVLLLFIALVPYRQGAGWAWWAVLLAVVVLCGAVLLRIAALHTFQGTATVGMILLVVIPSLLLHRVGGKTGGVRRPEIPPSS
jgi:hypothetical protein